VLRCYGSPARARYRSPHQVKRPFSSLGDDLPTGCVVKVSHVPVVVVAALAVVACSRSGLMQAWVGAHYDELIVSWGPPTAVAPLTSGGAMLTYAGSGHVLGSISGTALTGVATTCRRLFLIDADGLVQKVSWSGCMPTDPIPERGG